MYEDIISRCTLFSGLSAEEREYAQSYFSATPAAYEKGEILNRVGAVLERFGLVLSGTVQVYMYDIDGNRMIMANVGRGETFGESLCYLGREASVYICCASDAAVLWMSTEKLAAGEIKTAQDAALAARFTAMLAARTLAMNDRIQILSKITIRGKLTAFFTQCAASAGGQEFDIPFNRDDMAAYLGVNRSALSRELAHMRDEGIISFNKSHFVIR